MSMRHPLLTVTVLALASANALLLAYGQGWLGGNPGSAQREPQRLAAQLQPERLEILSAEEAARVRQPLVCREIGVLADEAALQAAEAALRDRLGLGDGAWQRQERALPGVYLLATRSAPTEADAQRQRALLARAGIDAIRPQSVMGEARSSWVLSRHDSEAEAQAALVALRAKGLALRVVTQRLPVTQQWLRVPALTAQQAKLTHPAWPGGLRPCDDAAPAVAAAASAASAAPSAASAQGQ